LPAGNLDPSRSPQLRLDVVDDGAQPLRRDVPLLGRLLQARKQLLGVEVLASAVLFDDEERDGLNPFVSGEALPALQAFPPPADRLADFGVARVDHLQVVVTAVRTAQ